MQPSTYPPPFELGDAPREGRGQQGRTRAYLGSIPQEAGLADAMEDDNFIFVIFDRHEMANHGIDIKAKCLRAHE